MQISKIAGCGFLKLMLIKLFYNFRIATSNTSDFPIEKYTYLRKLGEGKCGKVYLYELQSTETNSDLPKIVSVKTLQQDWENLVILSSGNHPRIVKIYGKCHVLGQYGIVMKGFDETLESYLENIVLTTRQPITIPEAKNILYQIAGTY